MKLLLILIMISLPTGDGQCLASIGGGCPPSWSKWGNHCYKVTDAALPWSEAKQECIRLGSIMAVPQSEQEIKHLNFSKQVWIDCSNVGDTWVVGEGVSIDTQWRVNQPSGDGKCVLMQFTDNKWNDAGCHKLFHAICKKTEAILHF
ncbi:snaclec jerdonibitin subunit beta-like [Asterias amurensis]|uniref:snaclec jerdonibitin subunit beta-like n=1 Tax=Asterias amurensis TaxID=7602 RepID=UPI003AB5C0E9